MNDILKRLGHKPLVIPEEYYGDYLEGKTVLVTGGGGSIGSGICKKISDMGVKALIIFDEYENGAYDIWQDILADAPHLEIKVVIGSICDRQRLREVFCKYRPEIIFHTAAHKHVVLMEENEGEAYKNNVEGTRNVLEEAKACGVERMIFVSTDKAANPAGVMGRTKKACEDMIREFDAGSLRVPAVRFGNVAGSNGSVIPLFKRQIERGGPLTVTRPDAGRYFMSMDEAVSFIITVGNIGNTGDIYVPDMGAMIMIEDIAKVMIEDSGKDIEITYTGIKAGEKVREELCGEGEELEATEIPGVFIIKSI